jgi:hypothetical protein
MYKNNLTKGIITVNFFSILSYYFLSSQGFASVTFSSGSGIKIFFAAEPYTDLVFFAADPDAQISGAETRIQVGPVGTNI